MRFSNLDCCVELWKPEKEDDGQGGKSKSYVLFCGPVWAEMLTPRVAMSGSSVNERQILGGTHLVLTQGVRMRYIPDVKRGFKLKHNGNEYEVLHVQHKCRSGEMILTTREVDYC